MEYFEIFSEQAKPLGRAPRNEVHKKGYWHRSVNILIQRSNTDIIIQLRSENKDVCPNAWDFSVCEHAQPGESFKDTAIRGLKEELGIIECDLRPIGPVYISKVENSNLQIQDNEFQQSFFAEYDGPIHYDQNEVAAVRWISPEKLRKELKVKPLSFTPWFREFMMNEMLI